MRGQVPELNLATRSHRHAPFHGVLKFAHISGPVVLHHDAQGIIMDAEPPRVHTMHLVEKMRHQ